MIPILYGFTRLAHAIPKHSLADEDSGVRVLCKQRCASSTRPKSLFGTVDGNISDVRN